MVGGQVRINDAPPLIFHPTDIGTDEFQAPGGGLRSYRETLPDDRRELLDRYRLVDGAIKVVGIGSVGATCLVS